MAVSVINTWTKPITGSNGYLYGTGTLQIANTTGNWLFGIVQWDETNADPNTIVWLADDAHNYWQPIKASASGHTLRTAVLLVQNALATPSAGGSTSPGLTNVYLSSNGFIRNPILTVIEVSGMQPGLTVDVATAGFINAASITLSANTTQADFILAACTHRFTTNSNITFSGAGWTSIAQTAQNATDTNVNGMMGASVYQSGAAGSYSVTFSQTDTKDWSGVIIAVASAGGLPVNSNISWPTTTVQAAFGTLPNAPADYYNWTDISSRYLGLSGERGKEFELDQLVAADFKIKLDNHDGALNPFNASGPYYPNVKLITPIRILMGWQGRTYRVFEGQFEFIPASYEDQYGVVLAECSDTYAKLPQVRLQSSMVQEILYDNPQWYWPLPDPAGSNFASNYSGNTFTVLDEIISRQGTGGATADFGATATPNLKGSQATVWAQSGIPTSSTLQGKSLRCLDDNLTNLTNANGVTVEFWANMPTAAWGLAIPHVNARYLVILHGPSARTSGQVLGIVDQPGGLVQFGYYDANSSAHTVSAPANYEDGLWHHYVLLLNSTNYQFYLDGVSVQSGAFAAGGPVTTNIEGIEFGGYSGRLANIGSYDTFGFNTPFYTNAQFAHCAYYNYQLEPERIVEHFNSGNGGFANEDSGQRVVRLLRYADWGKPQGVDAGLALAQRLDYMGSGFGYGSGGIASAFGLFGSFGQQHPTGSQGATGTQADLAIQDMALTENGAVYVDRNGTLFFRNRDNLYNGGVRAAFNDSFVPLNKNYLLNGLVNWTAVNTSHALTSGNSVWQLDGIHNSLLLTADGTANPQATSESTIPVLGNTSYTVNAWINAPAGYATVAITVSWFTSTNTFISTSTSSSFTVNPMTPTPLTYAATSPANAAFAQFTVGASGTPPANQQFVVSFPVISAAGYGVAFESDLIIGFDTSFLYNDVSVTRNVDGAFSRVIDSTSRNQYFDRTYSRTVFLAGTPNADVVTDNANWVLNAYKQPFYRIQQMTIDVASKPDAWDLVLRTDVGDIVTFNRTAPGVTPINQSFVVLKIEPEIGQDVATFKYSLGPILNPILTLDNPATGLLGPDALGW